MDPIEHARERLLAITTDVSTSGEVEFVSDSGGGYWKLRTSDGIELGVGVAATEEGTPHCGLSYWSDELPTGGGDYFDVTDLPYVRTWERIATMLPIALTLIRTEIASDLAAAKNAP